MSRQGWETNVDMWKRQSSGLAMELPSTNGVKMELPSTAHNEDSLMHAPIDEVCAGQSIQQAHCDQNQPDFKAEILRIGQFSDSLAKKTSEAPRTVIKTTETIDNLSKMSRGNDACYWNAYLSKLDVSEDLTHPELYNQCLSLMDLELNRTANEDACKLLYIEVKYIIRNLLA